MSVHDLSADRLMTPQQVADLFHRDLRWVYRHAAGTGLLHSAARRFSAKMLMFERETIARIIEAAREPLT